MMWRPTSLGHLLGAHDVEESLVSALLWQIEFFGIASIVLTCLALRRCLGARWLHALGIGGICLVLPAAIVFARDSLGAFLPIGVVALLVLFLVLVLRQRKQLKATQLQLIAEMDRELAKAHEMQMSLMPVTGLRTLKFDVAGRCLPASHVGGDYFQYNERDGHLRVSLADVTGHAMEAAIPAVLFSGVLESQEELGGDVGDLFGRLNSPAPRGAGAANTKRIVDDLALASGDSVLFCSSGIVNAQNSSGARYGNGRIARSLAGAGEHNSSAHDVLDWVCDDVFSFTENSQQVDDMFSVVLHVN